MKRNWWYSSRKMTVWVQTKKGTIVDGATIIRTFIGQPKANLKNWMKRQGGFKKKELE